MNKLSIKSGRLYVLIGALLSRGLTAFADTQSPSLLDELLPRPDGPHAVEPELSAVGDLPEVTTYGALTSIVKTILGASMILTVIAVIVVAIYYLMSQGEEEDLNKAKDIVLYLIIGIAIMAAAYGIISGVSQFNFFK